MRPIVTADSIYVTGIGMRRAQGERYNPKIVYALDLSSGKIRWGSEQGDYRRDMVLDEPYLYVLGKVKEPTSVGPYGPENRMYATLSAFDTRTGENVWNHTINENGTTSWANTGLYLGNGTGRKIVYLAGYESYYLEKPVDSVIWGTDGVIYGYSSVSTEPVPEFSKTYLLFTIATLALIPVLSRKRWVRHDA